VGVENKKKKNESHSNCPNHVCASPSYCSKIIIDIDFECRI
jgi:hypothetical protein